MKIDLTKIYKGLDKSRDERRINVQKRKENYLMFTMAKFGELSEHLYSLNSKNDATRKEAELGIVTVLCDIAVFTINAGAELPSEINPLFIEPKRELSVADIYIAIADFIREDYDCSAFDYYNFAFILNYCASVCESYGYNFEIAMLETIKEINSRTGSYNESAKKWVKDTSEQAKSKWYKADYEKARIEK